MAGEPLRSHGCLRRPIEPLHNKQEYSDYAARARWCTCAIKSTLASAYIRAHPCEFFRLTAERVARFWTGAGSEVNSGVVELHAVTTSLLGLLGLAALCKQRQAVAVLFLLPLLLFPLPYYITHPDFRFRICVGSAADDFERVRGLPA